MPKPVYLLLLAFLAACMAAEKPRLPPPPGRRAADLHPPLPVGADRVGQRAEMAQEYWSALYSGTSGLRFFEIERGGHCPTLHPAPRERGDRVFA